MDSCHHVCWGSLPFRHPSKAAFVQVFFIPSVCHQVSLSSLLLYHHFACSALLSWPILRSSAFPPPPLLWCGQLVFELDLTIRGASKAKRSVYNFKRANWPALKELLWHTPGDLAFFPNDVNKSLSTWTDLFVSAVNEHIPKWTTRSVSVQPLIDTELLTLIKKKNRQRKKESTKDESGHWCWEIPTTKTQNQRRVIFHVTKTTNHNEAKRKHFFMKCFRAFANQRSKTQFFQINVCLTSYFYDS